MDHRRARPKGRALSFCLRREPQQVYCVDNTAQVEDSMRTAIVSVAIAASFATSGCSRTHSEDGGPTVSRNYQVGGFDQIEVAGPYNVQVRTGANPGVSASGGAKLMEHMVVEVQNGKLLIHPE